MKKISVNGYKVTYTTPNNDYFFGSNVDAYQTKTKKFYTWEEAQAFYFEKKKEAMKCDVKWWVEKYVEDNTKYWNITDCKMTCMVME